MRRVTWSACGTIAATISAPSTTPCGARPAASSTAPIRRAPTPGRQPPALNLSTRVFQHFDAVGIVTNTITDPVTKQQLGYDFKGNPLGSSRGVFSDYKALPPLTAPPPTPDVFETSTRYDAL